MTAGMNGTALITGAATGSESTSSVREIMPTVPTVLEGPSSQLILASASPRRRELLAQLGHAFTVIPAEVTEHEAPDADPREMVRHNAALKADWMATRYPDATVIGADTTVFVGRTVLNKPRDA